MTTRICIIGKKFRIRFNNIKNTTNYNVTKLLFKAAEKYVLKISVFTIGGLTDKVCLATSEWCGRTPDGSRPWFLKLLQYWLVSGSGHASDLNKLWEFVSQSILLFNECLKKEYNEGVFIKYRLNRVITYTGWSKIYDTVSTYC